MTSPASIRKAFAAKIGRIVAVAALVAVATAPGARTASAQQARPNADWPCIQPRTGTVSAGAVWAGPDPVQAGPWDKDFEAAALAQKLASRRTAVEDVDALLDGFAAKSGPEKAVRLTRVFAGVLDLVNAERGRVLSGISRYAHGQTRLAERVRQESERVGDAADAPGAEPAKEVQDAETGLKWDKRIFEERGRSLTYVCETPVLLERRLFDVARRIQRRL